MSTIHEAAEILNAEIERCKKIWDNVKDKKPSERCVSLSMVIGEYELIRDQILALDDEDLAEELKTRIKPDGV